jgi:acyl carrier protein
MSPEQVEIVKACICKEARVDKSQLKLDSDFNSFDIDSFGLLTIALEIEVALNISLLTNARDMENMKKSMTTFKDLLDFLDLKMATKNDAGAE